jgi:UTP-glucose-1-phosphate uridylyltransferase
VKPNLMTFDGDEVEVQSLNVKKPLYWVFADLCGEKDTVKILRDLNRAYPFASNEQEQLEQQALGQLNQDIINRAIKYMAEGEPAKLGQLMTEAEELFNSHIMPMCPSELEAPKLRATLADPNIQPLVYGGKGVGSHGDGSVQFLARDPDCQQKLIDYLKAKGMKAYPLTIKPVHTVRRAIIPVAGFGTRLYPATRALKKDFFPIPCTDGMVRPVILILIEELIQSGIEEICLVLGSEDERRLYADFFERPIDDDHMSKLSKEAQEYENHIVDIGKRLRYVYQREKRGFGHAVYQAAQFARNEPVLLMLGDTLYRSLTNKPCALQLIEEYERYNCLIIGLYPVALGDVSHFGIMNGVWEDKDERILNVTTVYEKPTSNYAEEFLAVRNSMGTREYCSVFGQYILTPEVFEQLAHDISEADAEGTTREIELTSALEAVRSRVGMIGVRLYSQRFDMGNPAALVDTITKFSHI